MAIIIWTNLFLISISQLNELGAKLRAITPILVADAFFSKYEYVNAVEEQGMEFISRFRSDANLRYLHNGPQKARRGRKKQYAGKVNTKKIYKRRAKLIHEDSEMRVYTLIVNAINLKMNIRLAYVEYLNSKG
ncbi:MAG: transposase [Saprospiraceae bacterium]|nr:transposase [Saprospiraceae bacterium]